MGKEKKKETTKKESVHGQLTSTKTLKEKEEKKGE
jgi:hypothetical protein